MYHFDFVSTIIIATVDGYFEAPAVGSENSRDPSPCLIHSFHSISLERFLVKNRNLFDCEKYPFQYNLYNSSLGSRVRLTKYFVAEGY